MQTFHPPKVQAPRRTIDILTFNFNEFQDWPTKLRKRAQDVRLLSVNYCAEYRYTNYT